MKDDPAESVLSSRLIKFIVGEKKAEYTLHSYLVAQQSPALDVLINGEMKEAKEGCVNWEGVEEQAFLCFSQYIYTGQYEAQKLFSNNHESGSIDYWRARLLCHAHTYCFADCYGIHELLDSSFKKLDADLKHAQQNRTVITVMPALVKLCWPYQSPPALQAMLLNHVVDQIKNLWTEESFSVFLEDCPEFSTALLKKIVQRQYGLAKGEHW
ncbi:hypothetical protein C2857_006214 [Epichloe festucae Fl1]|uniref:BTB domain-containing protein n=1 Tax=Epichloe festucae (strain Fl1) TaxID=877507 RepID=A0A7S9KQ00_EPIFF|nr:hypothetical protein C2857_006214 [Epichloe festucae Fl1]